VVVTGTPEEVAACSRSYTGAYMNDMLNRKRLKTAGLSETPGRKRSGSVETPDRRGKGSAGRK
jgi:hypothetical protein